MRTYLECLSEAAEINKTPHISAAIKLELSDEELSLLQEAADMYAELSNSHKHSVMQAEASASVKGAAVGNSAAGQSGRVGCVHNTLKYIGPWYSCETCGTHFNARAEAPPEGALPF